MLGPNVKMSNSTNHRPRILVFDSGLGGLSIVGELQRANIECDIYYLADTAFFPYGEKSDASLIDRLPMIIQQAVNHCAADLVIIGCNTASTLALDQVRARLNLPVIGVVPAIKPAAALTKTGTIGLLATPNTVSRPYTDQLISDFAQGVTVVRHGAIGLAGAAEDFLCGSPLNHSILKASMDGLFGQRGGDNIDVVVLACTHYPHLKRELAALAPRPVTWVDSGAAIARRARTLLDQSGDGHSLLATAFTSGGEDAATARGLKSWGFGSLERLV
jgi:glutamate racemase